MNNLTIPYYLVIPTILCIVGLGMILYFRQRLFRKNSGLWTSMTVLLIAYLFIVGSATYEDLYYQWDLNRYDLDKDGVFGGREITKGQILAMQKLTNDVGRNFSFITGFIFAVIASLITYIITRMRILILKPTTAPARVRL